MRNYTQISPANLIKSISPSSSLPPKPETSSLIILNLELATREEFVNCNFEWVLAGAAQSSEQEVKEQIRSFQREIPEGVSGTPQWMSLIDLLPYCC
jgi:hypothetical protein